MSNIPRAREIIAKAIGTLPVGDPTRAMIEAALPMLVKHSPIRKSEAKSRAMTLALACEIWRYHRRNPRASHQEIAVALSVNMGRVSEVLTQTRYKEARRLSLYKFNK